MAVLIITAFAMPLTLTLSPHCGARGLSEVSPLSTRLRGERVRVRGAAKAELASCADVSHCVCPHGR